MTSSTDSLDITDTEDHVNSDDHSTPPVEQDGGQNDDEMISEAITQYEQAYLKALLNLKTLRCESCQMLIMDVTEDSSEDYVCMKCSKGTNNKNLPANSMDPGQVPAELQGLTLVEEMAISLIHPQVKVHRIKGSGQLRYSGNIISFPQDVSAFSSSLPHAIESIPIIFLTKVTERDGIHGVRHFRIRGPKVKAALIWLKLNNRLYRDVTLNHDVLSSFPADGDVSNRVRRMRQQTTDEIEETDGFDNADDTQAQESFVPQVLNVNEESEVLGALNLQYPTISNAPIDEFRTPGFIPAAFPTLFPYGRPCLKDDRPLKLTPKAYFKKLILHADGRFARHPSFRFFALNIIQRWEAVSQGNVFVKKQDLQNVSAEEIRNRIRNDRNFLRKVMSYAATIPGTDSFWFKKSSELRTMIEQLGMPTLFFTLSYADLHEPDLGRILRSFPNQTSAQSKLVNENPILVDWFFHEKVKLFFSEVVAVKYRILDSWTRFEYQFRGSPHVHGLLWLDESPDTSFLDTRIPTPQEKLIIEQYFDKIVTAMNPNCDEAPADIHPSSIRFNEVIHPNQDMAQLLDKVQKHSHNRFSCMRKKPGSNREFCRFNFPHEMREAPELLQDPNNNRFTFFPRRNDPYLNKFNISIMRSWRANLDISPVTSKQALIQYVAKYTAKPETSRSETFKKLIEICAAQDNSGSTPNLIRRFMCKAIGRDMSSQEVSHLILGLPLVISSRTTESLSTVRSDWVSITHADDSDDPEVPPDRLSRYYSRPQRMNNLTYYEFAKRIKVYKRSGSLHYSERHKEAIIQIWPRYEQGKGYDEQYFEQQLVLHVAHRNEAELRICNESWRDAFQRHSHQSEQLTVDWENIEEEEDDGSQQSHSTEVYLEWMALHAAGPSGDIPDVAQRFRPTSRLE